MNQKEETENKALNAEASKGYKGMYNRDVDIQGDADQETLANSVKIRKSAVGLGRIIKVLGRG